MLGLVLLCEPLHPLLQLWPEVSDQTLGRKGRYSMNPSSKFPRLWVLNATHLSVTQQSSVYLYWPGGPITQSANGVALYLLADLPEGVDLSWPGIPLHKAGHHFVHPVDTCSTAARRA